MINKLIRASVEQWGLVFVLTLALALLGWFSFQTLPIDAVPDITNKQVQINSAVPGLIPEEIESYVSFPIESAMGGIPGLQEVRSISRFGLSQVTLIFNEDADIYLVRQLVSEKLQNVKDQLPPGVQPQLGPLTTGLGEIFFYSLQSRNPEKDPQKRLAQLMELKALNEWHIKPRLLTVKGVAEINTIGGFEKSVYVKPDLEKMARYGIHLRELVQALEQNNRNTGGGYIQQTAEQLLVQAQGMIESPDAIQSIVIKRLSNLETVTIGQVAAVGLDKEQRTGAALVNGKESVIGTVLMLFGENSRTVALEVGAKVEEIRQGLPLEVELQVLYNRSVLVNKTLTTVEKNLTFGAFLVMVILLLLIGQVRVALITAATIPLALLSTFILMRWFNISGNLMSLGALDFGIIIDGAVIVMDNCIRKVDEKAISRDRQLSRSEIRETVIEATTEIRAAAGFGQLIVLIVFLPIFALTGVEAKMFVPMASTFCFALGAAFLISFTTIPALAAQFLRGKPKQRPNRLLGLLERGYGKMINLALGWKKTVLGLGLLAIVSGVWLFSQLGADFLPQLDEGSIAIQFVRPTNINIDQSIAMQAMSEGLIGQFEEVSLAFSRIGTAEVATDPMGVNLSDTYVLLKPHDQWPKHEGAVWSKLELLEAIQTKLNFSIPGQTMIFSQPIQLRFNELLEGVRSDVALKIYGDDLEQLDQIASQAEEIIRKIPGAGDVEKEVQGKSPVLQIRPDITALQGFGIPKDNILSTVETAIGGVKVGDIFEGVMRFPIVVRLSERDRQDLEQIGKLPVGVSENLTVPLQEVASIGIRETSGDIRRDAFRKRTALLINVRNRDTQSFVEEAKAQVQSQIELPAGVFVEWGGSFKNLALAKERLMVVVPIALVLIFMMIYMAFRSLIQTVMIFTCVPMSLVGGVLGLQLNQLDFSISAAIGFITLSGIAVLNGVVLISFFNRLKLDGLTGDELIRKGTRLRLRPVLMTATAAAFGFLPMMFSTGAGAEVQRPLASVVVGGIVLATLLTLIVLPVLYRLLEHRMQVAESSLGH
ncbi:MAG: hypothetical protein A2600_06340 [Candidatus Lambdaproteobacteria bacterium RIFOXYD1_FULL_56_27]|uniref:Cation transporter n=1 Tax=Candidatus Lambdaproteobacteria bacterium RIFOXYD2_FULL_56_26 TaxID=1817773 RepID=A0A1F6H0A5_9PROT|nr:MAG: hypothetical protein A2426_00940 [Candidatus Lambdaproteobacteria bacterium RIFOXYC1_FULL_56_13]OGH03828.1 MAG: hypothetical protein A2557_11850 [Candidatus Lambdaproteobacteria bacterium RIFOXYD2_FULL_56_26]OGH08956.1 MAG: hypothetical protein A2600_06340 [Candidatus Lambdaproteobacteria bacterium RIFOXYD1_FULL_56_27]